MIVTNTKRAAFTLIELLTVIAIIGILAAILIPVVGSVRATARAAVCSSSLRQCGLGLLLLAEGDGGNIRARSGGGGAPGLLWAERLMAQGIISGREIVFCPTARHGLDDIYNPGAGGTPPGGGEDEWALRTGFGVFMMNNAQILSPPGQMQMVSPGPGQPVSLLWVLNTEQVETPSRYPLMADSMQARGIGSMRIDSITASRDAVAMRHGRRANVFFLDGHVETANSDRMGQLGFQSGYGETVAETVQFNTSLFNR
jgi:prepilin-type N-terminal cleavage/methylation domain-containing protein/prepilin-type processing-associated H-X9-DG protein